MADIDEKEFAALLPKLKGGSDSKVGAFTSAGAWDNRQANELSNLSESLDVAQIDPKYFDIDSIPDMWARPLLFEMALYDPTHPLHERILGEWRGLLALLALRALRGLAEVQFVPVDIPRIEEEKDAREKEKQETKPKAPKPESEVAGPDFLRALGRLAPTTTLSSDTSWHHCYVIVFNKKPIGLTSPTTLLCTAADCIGRLDAVAWFGTRFLEDPISSLSPVEKEALAGWLERVKSSLLADDHVKHGGGLWNSLSRLLEGFVEGLDVTPDLEIELTESSTQMEGLFSHIDRVVTSTKGDPTKSDVRIVPSEGKKPPLTLLVVDESIAKQWKKPKKEITVLGTKTLASVPLGGLSGPRNILLTVSLHDDRHAAEWRTPNDFFTDSLFVVEHPDAFLNTIKVKGDDRVMLLRRKVTPILPLKEEILSYLSTKDIARRLVLEASEDKVEVRLKLPLAGSGENPREFEISRTYTFRDGQVKPLINRPAIELWPSFAMPAWHAYYTYVSIINEADTFYARPYPPPRGSQADVTARLGTYLRANGRVEREITRTDGAPEALVCTAHVADLEGEEMLSTAAGLLLLEPPDSIKVAPTTEEWRIGVDFGTTSTNVYARKGTDEPIRLDVDPSLRQVTNNLALREDDLHTGGFLPPEKAESPFLTFFHAMREPMADEALRPLLDGHVFFIKELERFKVGKPKVEFNLKWGKARDRLFAKAFLEQLCLLCCAEIVKIGAQRVSWAFSFPTAFPPEDRDEFRGIWRDISQRCQITTGLVSDPTIVEESESVASAKFFIRPPEKIRDTAPAITSGAVCVDIGGGTSDISVWQGPHELKFQTSLLFAGRDIMIHLLSRNPAFFKRFGADVGEAEKHRGNQDFTALADATVKHNASYFLSQLPIIGAHEDVKEFVRLVALGLSGLVYYIGLVLRYLADQGKYIEKMPAFYFGGNGARFFHLIAWGLHDPKDSRLTHLLRALLVRTTGFSEKNFEMHVSQYPKAEVAYGLVRRDIELTYDANKYEGEFIAGEDFRIDQKDAPWSELVDKNVMKSNLTISPDLKHLRELIEVFDSCSRDSGIPQPAEGSYLTLDSPGVAERVAGKVNDRLSIEGRKNPSAVRVEPVFITALKVFLEMKADEWGSRQVDD